MKATINCSCNPELNTICHNDEGLKISTDCCDIGKADKALTPLMQEIPMRTRL